MLCTCAMNAMCFGAMLVIDFTLHVEVMKNEWIILSDMSEKRRAQVARWIHCL